MSLARTIEPERLAGRRRVADVAGVVLEHERLVMLPWLGIATNVVAPVGGHVWLTLQGMPAAIAGRRLMRRVPACLLAAASVGCAVMALSCSSPPGAPGGLPLAPSPPVSSAGITDLQVQCQSPVLVGETSFCSALYRRFGVPSDVSIRAAWSSSQPDTFVNEPLGGGVTAKVAGTATITARYEGLEASGQLTSELVDGLKIKAAWEQGEFRAGGQVTMALQGNYAVASAPTGRLFLSILSDNGNWQAASGATVVSGGDRFTLSMTFTVPTSTTRLCRAAVLIIGDRRLSEPPPGPSIISCVPVVQP